MTEALLGELLRLCRVHEGEITEELRRASGAFCDRARDDLSLLEAAGKALQGLPPAGATWLAVVLGAAIEGGRGAERSAPAVVDLLRSWLPRLPIPSEEEGVANPEPTPEQAALLRQLPMLCQSIVSHLAQLPERRAALAGDAALVGRLEGLQAYSHGATWIYRMLLCCSGALVVLHPPSGKGLQLRYENVANAFHLFSLLQIAVGERLPGGRRPDKAVIAAAKGEAQAGTAHDRAWWHYGNPHAKTPALGASIWGEGSIREIPIVKGARVMLLWPPILQSRGWNSGFFGPHLQQMPSDVVLDGELTRQESQTWFEELGLEFPKGRKWWPWG